MTQKKKATTKKPKKQLNKISHFMFVLFESIELKFEIMNIFLFDIKIK